MMRALVLAAFLLATTPPAIANDQPLADWLKDLRQEALSAGISPALVTEALPDTLQVNEKILRLDRKQPEKTISFERYKKNVVSPARIHEGRRLIQENAALLNEIGAHYGVEPEYIVALWGIETNFGKHTGGFETVPALVTLAYDGRRGAYFRGELIKALRIIDQGHIGLHAMKGSWAGAMGQCQFMPTSFEKFAQDYDGDGHRDIWGTRADVFASIAAYLSGSGWKKGQTWRVPVILPPGFDKALLTIDVQKPVYEWQALGLRQKDGSALPAGVTDLASVAQPGGDGYKAYIVYDNYRVIMDWNRSTYFATAVGVLAQALK